MCESCGCGHGDHDPDHHAKYHAWREEVTEQVRSIRQKHVGELADQVTDTVRKHPLLGISVAAVAGFFLGRLFRR